MPRDARLVTAEELERFPDDDDRYELVEGRAVRMSPVGFEHGRIVMRLGTLLVRHAQPRSLGVVVTEAGFKVASNPDTQETESRLHSAIADSATEGSWFWNGPPIW